MAATGSSVQPVDRRGKKPAIKHTASPTTPYGQPRRDNTTGTARAKVANQSSPTGFQSLRTDFHGASITAGTPAGPILGDYDIDSGVSDLDPEPPRNHRISYEKNFTAKTKAGEVALLVTGMSLVDGYMIVGQELGGLLNPPGAVASDSEARLAEENTMKENIAQLRQEIKDTRSDKEALQKEVTELKQGRASAAASLQEQKDESKRLNTRSQEVTEQRNEVEKKNNELHLQVSSLRNANSGLADSLQKANAEIESRTKQHDEEVQGLEEEIGKLQTVVSNWTGEPERIEKECEHKETSLQEKVAILTTQVQTDKAALESKCQNYECEKTSLQERVNTLEEQIDLVHGMLNVILDQSSLDHDLRDEEIGILRSDNDRWRAEIKELEEDIRALNVVHADSESGRGSFRAPSEHRQRSSSLTHRGNEVRRLRGPRKTYLNMVRNNSGE